MLESLDILENLVHRNTMIGVLCSQKYYLFNFVNSYYDFYGEWFITTLLLIWRNIDYKRLAFVVLSVGRS